MVAQCKSSKGVKTILAATFATCLRNLNWNNVIHQNNNNRKDGCTIFSLLQPFSKIYNKCTCFSMSCIFS